MTPDVRADVTCVCRCSFFLHHVGTTLLRDVIDAGVLPSENQLQFCCFKILKNATFQRAVFIFKPITGRRLLPVCCCFVCGFTHPFSFYSNAPQKVQVSQFWYKFGKSENRAIFARFSSLIGRPGRDVLCKAVSVAHTLKRSKKCSGFFLAVVLCVAYSLCADQ